MYRPKKTGFFALSSWLILSWTTLALGITDSAAPENFWLITPEEAALPARAVDNKFGPESGITELSAPLPNFGPIINIESPKTDKENSSPLDINIKFTPRESPVDISSLEVILVKFFDISLTDRIRPFATSEGIHVKDVPMPTGEHTVRLKVSDRNGKVSVREIMVKVV